MTAHAPKRRFFRVAAAFFAVTVMIAVGDLLLVRSYQKIHVSYEITRITGPKLADGSIDYLRALEDCFSRGVTPENNAAIPILQALGRAALPPSQPRDGITDRLGMPPLPDKGDYYITYADYFRSRTIENDSDPTDSKTPLTWPAPIAPAIAEWVKANEKPLALLTEASYRPRYFIPFNGGNRPSTLYSVLLPQLGLLHNTRRALLTRAVIRLNEGDPSGFADDIRTAHHLARLLGQDSTMVGRMVAAEYERSTCRVQRLGIASGKLSPQQMRQMLDDLAQMGDLPSIVEAVENCERLIGLDALQSLARADDKGRAELFNGLFNSNNPEAMFRFWPIDYDKCMGNLNRGYDDLILALQRPTYAQRLQALDFVDLKLDLVRRDGPVRMMLSSDWPSMMLLPGMRQAIERAESTNLDGRLTQISLALELFKSEHGVYPAALSELAPSYLEKVPMDFFAGQPLIYSRDAKGFTVYSVGPNVTDDGGKGDDLVVSAP